MSTYLRDQLQVARLGLMKARLRKAWAERRREAEAANFPVCEGCGKRHAPSANGAGLVGILRALGAHADGDDDDTPQAPGSHLN